MTDAELHVKIRALMSSGALPSGHPSIARRGSTEAESIAVGNPFPAQCTICGEADTQVALFYPAGLVVRLHDGCEALWEQEREQAK